MLTTNRGRASMVLATCCLSLLIVSMDATIVNVAIPAIRTDLHAPLSRLQWIIDAYTLTLAGLLMLSGGLADRFGRRRVFRIGLVIFALGSLLCSLSTSVDMLIGARFVQAVGGSMLNPVAMSIITHTFTGAKERARAVGIWGAVVGVSMAIGPIVGGVLIDTLGWQSVFWINLPICVVALIGTALYVPESKSATARGMDPIGQLLAMIFLLSLTFAMIEHRTVVLVVSAVAFAGFLYHEGRHPNPFVDLRFFRSVPFAAATATAVMAFAGFGAFLFLCSLYLQEVRHFSAVHTGLLYLPMAGAVLICSPLSGRLVGRLGTRIPLLIAGCCMAVGGLLLTRIGTDTPQWELVMPFAIFGIGFGTVNAPITTSAVSGMPLDRAGAASAVASTSRQVGVSIGVALCGSSVNPVGSGVWWIIAVLAVGVTVLGVVSNTAWAVRSRDRVAPLLEQEAPVDVR